MKIFSYLKSDELCRSCARVCRKWYYLAWDPTLWQTISFDAVNIDVDRGLRAVTRLLSRDVNCRQRPGVYSIDEHDYLTSSTIKSNGSANQTPLSVHVLHVDNSFTLTDRGLILIARKCPDLRSLRVHSCANVSVSFSSDHANFSTILMLNRIYDTTSNRTSV